MDKRATVLLWVGWLLAVSWADPGPVHASTCADFLVPVLGPNRYVCLGTVQGGGPFVDVFTFSLSAPGDFSLTRPGDVAYNCSCRATGSPGRPKFDQGKEFLCVLTSPVSSSLDRQAIWGKVAGGGARIPKGEIVTGGGVSSTFACEREE